MQHEEPQRERRRPLGLPFCTLSISLSSFLLIAGTIPNRSTMNTPVKLSDRDNMQDETPNISNRSPVDPQLAVEMFRAIKPTAPSKRLLESLYNIATEEKDSHQTHLKDSSAGDCVVLSLEDVWLPAAVYQVHNNLKAVQAKIQRDGTHEQVEQVKNARLYLINQLKRSLLVVQKNRQSREENYRKFLLEEKERQRQERKEECRRQQEAKRKNHPYNQDLWREAAALMTELQKLEKEELLWDEALQRLPNDFETPPTEGEDKADNMEVDYSANTPLTEELTSTMQMLDDLQLWTRRVRSSVAQIQPAMDRAEALRKQLYQQHQSGRFKGYPGMEQPKDLLRILSQDSEAQ